MRVMQVMAGSGFWRNESKRLAPDSRESRNCLMCSDAGDVGRGWFDAGDAGHCWVGFFVVSYSHLLASEAVLDLVRRLLLV